MFFEEEELDFHIFGVDHIKWEAWRGEILRRPYAALALRVSGEGQLSCAQNSVSTAAGNLLFVPQGVDYSAAYTDTEIFVIHFVTKKTFTALENCTLASPESILPLYRRAYQAWQSKQAGYRMEIAALLLEILVSARRQALRPGNGDISFARAIAILQQEYRNFDLNIAEVARRAGISDSYFRRQCRRRFGMSPVQYLTERRLTHAEHLLHFPSYSIERVAMESGFADAKYFARVVKRLRGCTPSQLRFF